MSNDETLTPSSSEFDTLLASDQSRERREGLQKGTSAGRYFVLGHIGSGGMADVYSAYDPELDRRIALKLMRPSRGTANAEGDIARMVREARAMAKVSHPNVISVFDVGMLDDRLFLAMEFVDGCNLEQWLARDHRTWEEIRDVFILAGKGLAAAHARGLVHRDFKPANVLVDEDRGVHVADFGLAFGHEAQDDPSMADLLGDSIDRSRSDDRPYLSRLTATGTVLGTPAYMSPEQHCMSTIDARSDQFSFCVALFEAWFQYRPFRGDTLPTLAASVCEGALEDPPRDSKVPSRQRRAVIKGLSVDPGDRHASMSALLAELSPPKVDRRGIALAALGVAGLAVGAGWALVGEETPRCDDQRQQLGTAWDRSRRDAVSRALNESEAYHAPATTDRVISDLDAYARSWLDAHRDACHATHMWHEQSETTLDLRMACLRRRRAAFDGLTETLALGRDHALDRAIDATSTLPRISHCADIEGLLDGVPPPAVEDEPRLERLEAALERSVALNDLGEPQEAEDLAMQILEDARAIGYPPFIGRVLSQLGFAQAANGKEALSEETMLQAFEQAIEAGDDRGVARIASRMVYIASQRTERYEAADLYYRVAAAALRRVGEDDSSRATLLLNYGQSLSRRGRSEEGLALINEAVEIRRRDYGPQSLPYAKARLSMGHILYDLGRIDELEEISREVESIFHRRYGEEHPRSLSLLNGSGVLSLLRYDFELSRDQFLRAIAVTERALGPSHIKVLDLKGNLALPYTALGEFDLAARELDAVIAEYVKRYGETSQSGEWLINRADVETAQGHWEEARVYLDRAREIYEDDPDRASHLGTVLVELSRVELGLGSSDRAVELATEGHRLLLSDYGPEHPRRAKGLVILLDALVSAGRDDEARDLLEESWPAVAKGAEPGELGELDFIRARIMHEHNGTEAIALARSAHEVLSRAPHRFLYLQTRGRIERWLASAGEEPG